MLWRACEGQPCCNVELGHRVRVAVRRQPAGVGSPLPPFRSQESNSSCQAWWQVLFLSHLSSLGTSFSYSPCGQQPNDSSVVASETKTLVPLCIVPSSLCRKLLPLEQFTSGMKCRIPKKAAQRGALVSEDADPLSQPLHLMVLGQTGATQVPFCRCPMAFCHKLIPACVVALVRDISFAHLSL